VFTFSVVSGPAPCARPNEVINGVAAEFSIGSVRQLMAACSTDTRINGTGWVGAKPRQAAILQKNRVSVA
jgi:hypothetical protein